MFYFKSVLPLINLMEKKYPHLLCKYILGEVFIFLQARLVALLIALYTADFRNNAYRIV